MARKALCIGINDYPVDGSDLNGCVNDAKAWAAMLLEHFAFKRDDIKLLLDAEATRDAIMDALSGLVNQSRGGDILVFTNSSHGTYVADKDGDESYDQALCPYDCKQNLILDDELRKLFAQLPADVSLTVISDSCFSGTVTRAARVPTPDHRRVRFLNPIHLNRRTLNNPFKAKVKSENAFSEDRMKDLLLTGCQNNEYSYDAEFQGTYHGAMTYFALEAIRNADFEITWDEMHAALITAIGEANYPQHPQLEGSTSNKRKRVFS